jgi:hypothetical protein
MSINHIIQQTNNPPFENQPISISCDEIICNRIDSLGEIISDSEFALQKLGLNRFTIGLEGVESKDQLGSNLSINRYLDDGKLIGEVFSIDRQTGDCKIDNDLTVINNLSVGGDVVFNNVIINELELNELKVNNNAIVGNILTVGSNLVVGAEILTETMIVDSTSNNALVVRQNNVGNNVLVVNTTESKVNINGDLNVTGVINTTNVNTLSVEDPVIELASQNNADLLDIGIYGKYSDSGNTKYTALFRRASLKEWFLVEEIDTPPNLIFPPITTPNLGVLNCRVLRGLDSIEGNLTGNVTGNLTGNVTGNVTGTSSTVTNATQSSITTLPNIISIQGQSLSSSVWPYVSSLNQNLSTSSSPVFNSLSLSNGISAKVGSFTNGVTGVVNTSNQPNITTLDGLTSIQNQTISSSVWPYVSTLNQNLSTSSNPTFNTVTANLTGNVSGNASTAGSASTVTNPTQSSITNLPNLTSIGSLNTLTLTRTDTNPLIITMNQNNATRAYNGIALQRQGVEKSFIGLGPTTDDFIVRMNTVTDVIKVNTTKIQTNAPLSLLQYGDNTNGNITSGLYVPLATAITNLSSATANNSLYSRIGDTVTISGSVNIVPSSGWGPGTIMACAITYPVISTGSFAVGVAGGCNGFPFTFSGNISNRNTTTFLLTCTCAVAVVSGGNYAVSFSGQYLL